MSHQDGCSLCAHCRMVVNFLEGVITAKPADGLGFLLGDMPCWRNPLHDCVLLDC